MRSDLLGEINSRLAADGDDRRLILLTQGHACVVDSADCEWLTQTGVWCFSVGGRGSKHPYAVARVVVGGLSRVTRMHRLILGAGSGDLVDHESGDTLDNTRKNLRSATKGQNNMNARKPRSGAFSRFKGVSRHKQTGKWQAGIKINQRRVHLGLFTSEEDASRVYDRAAAMYFGAFAQPNTALVAEPGALARELAKNYGVTSFPAVSRRWKPGS